MEPIKLTKTLTKRLPLYLNHLKSLPGDDCNISATTIANALGLGEVQVRKDLAKISVEGRRRTGRSRNQLIQDIETCLGCAIDTASIFVGSVEALTVYQEQDSSGNNVIARFDLIPGKKSYSSDKPAYSINRMESFCKHYNVQIGIIAVSCDQAQAVCDGMIACGIRSIRNFSPVSLRVPQGILLQSEQPVSA